MSLFELLASVNGDQGERDFRIYGAVTGIVQDIKDPNGLGRVKVDFPWLAEKKEDTVSIDGKDARTHSYWARIATLMAGGERGSYFIPEIDDEVLVVFEHGALDRPCIIGVLWNKKDKPPETMDADGKNDIRAIHTRSGHKLIFNDSKDKPSITIEDNSGRNFIVIDTKENAMTIESAGDLTINAGGKITIKAGKDVSVSAGASFDIGAESSGEIKTGSALDIKSDLKVAIEGSVRTEVKGKMVAVDGTAVTEIKGGIVKIN